MRSVAMYKYTANAHLRHEAVSKEASDSHRARLPIDHSSPQLAHLRWIVRDIQQIDRVSKSPLSKCIVSGMSSKYRVDPKSNQALHS